MGAVFDSTGTYRYALWRVWNADAPRVAFILLNPSTADASTNDPTIHRCIRFAQTWGYGSLDVVNLFAYRTVTPLHLTHARDPVGLDNDRYLLDAAERSACVVLGWGNWGGLYQRDRSVLHLLPSHLTLHCLGINQSGHPRHPLYIKSNTPLRAYSPSG